MQRSDRHTSARSLALRMTGVTVLIAVLFAAALLTGSAVLSTALRSSRTADTAQANAEDALAFDGRVQIARAALSEYFVDRDPGDVDAFWAANHLADIYATRLARALRGNAGAGAALARQHALNERLDALGARYFRVVDSGDTAAAHRLALEAEANVEAQAGESAIVRAVAQRRERAALATAGDRLDRVRALLIVLAAAALAVGALLAALLTRTVARSFRRVRESEDRFRTLVSNIPGAVYRRRADRDWSMLFLSARIEQIAGRPPADFTTGATGYASIVEPDHRAAVVEVVTATDGGDTFTVDYPVTHADGTTRWVRDIGQVVRGDDHAVEYVDGTISDVTALRRLEAEREDIERELRLAQRLEAVGQLASGIAHEIKTPVQFIGDSVRFVGTAFDDLQPLLAAYRDVCVAAAEGRADAPELAARVVDAEEDADLEYLQERVPSAIERMRNGIERISSIVGAMGEFGYVGTDEHVPADLNRAIESTLVVARNEYKYVADVETELGDLPPVACNVGQVSQVFLNLIVNAAHAIDAARTGDDGTARGTIRIATRREGDSALVTISDTGTGIPAAIVERIFDPFFTTKEAGKGTGQGLAISRSIIVDKHDGVLTVDSRPGAGTTFAIRLPLDSAKAAPLPAAA